MMSQLVMILPGHIYCDVTMSNDIVMCTYHGITMHNDIAVNLLCITMPILCYFIMDSME